MRRSVSSLTSVAILFAAFQFITLVDVRAAQGVVTSTTSYSITISPAPLSFGSISMKTFTTRTEQVANSGSGRAILTGVQMSGAGFWLSAHPPFPYALSVGSSVPLTLKFAPQSAGTATGSMSVHYKYQIGNIWHWASQTIQISGTGISASGSIGVSPSSLNFGSVQLSTTKTLSETVTNSGSSAITISGISATGAGFAFAGINPPVTLSAGQSDTFHVSFTPTSGGSVAGALTINSNAFSASISVPLSGTGASLGQLAVSPSSTNFGNVAVGSRKSLSGSVTASNGAVTVSGVNSSSLEFSIAGISFPLVLNAGQTASYQLTFAPTASGSASATITWASNATNSSPVQNVSGSGTVAAQHSVTLSWRASSSSNVVGYNVYRSTQSGGAYTKINGALDTATQDVDNSVQAGVTYYYVVTAVNSAGVESSYSSQVQAVVPSP